VVRKPKTFQTFPSAPNSIVPSYNKNLSDILSFRVWMRKQGFREKLETRFKF